jgi:hypothetical protein
MGWVFKICRICAPHAQDAQVRDAALSALLRMYGDAGNLAPLHAFTTRFQARCAPPLPHTCAACCNLLPPACRAEGTVRGAPLSSCTQQQGRQQDACL